MRQSLTTLNPQKKNSLVVPKKTSKINLKYRTKYLAMLK